MLVRLICVLYLLFCLNWLNFPATESPPIFWLLNFIQLLEKFWGLVFEVNSLWLLFDLVLFLNIVHIFLSDLPCRETNRNFVFIEKSYCIEAG